MYTVNMHMCVHTYKLRLCTVHAYICIDINIHIEYTTHIQVHKYKATAGLSDEIFTTLGNQESNVYSMRSLVSIMQRFQI
jgi:hypothetical protein